MFGNTPERQNSAETSRSIVQQAVYYFRILEFGFFLCGLTLYK